VIPLVYIDFVDLQQEAGFLYEEKEVESQTTSGSETLQIELPKV
jgi:hypothetical protein